MSETQTVTIADFLLARIAEDEEWAQTSGTHTAPGAFARDNYGCLLVTTDRVLAECEAKRTIVVDLATFRKVHEDRAERDNVATALTMAGIIKGLERAVMILALPYAEHADYRPEWRP